MAERRPWPNPGREDSDAYLYLASFPSQMPGKPGARGYGRENGGTKQTCVFEERKGKNPCLVRIRDGVSGCSLASTNPSTACAYLVYSPGSLKAPQ